MAPTIEEIAAGVAAATMSPEDALGHLDQHIANAAAVADEQAMYAAAELQDRLSARAWHRRNDRAALQLQVREMDCGVLR